MTDSGCKLTLHHLVDVLAPIHEAMALPRVHVQGHILVAVCLHLLDELLHCLHEIASACIAYTCDSTEAVKHTCLDAQSALKHSVDALIVLPDARCMLSLLPVP